MTNSVQYMLEVDKKLYSKLNILGFFDNSLVIDKELLIDTIKYWKSESEKCGYIDPLKYEIEHDEIDKFRPYKVIGHYNSKTKNIPDKLEFVYPCFIDKAMPLFKKCSGVESEINVFGANIRSTKFWFKECTFHNLKFTVDNSKLTDMRYMFSNCKIQYLDLSELTVNKNVNAQNMIHNPYSATVRLKLGKGFDIRHCDPAVNVFDNVWIGYIDLTEFDSLDMVYAIDQHLGYLSGWLNFLGSKPQLKLNNILSKQVDETKLKNTYTKPKLIGGFPEGARLVNAWDINP